jgi:hypothetical protein
VVSSSAVSGGRGLWLSLSRLERPSWLGFLLLGTDHVFLSANIAERNVGRTQQSGGTVLASSAKWGGADPTDNVVKDNVVLENRPFDIRWDETGSGNVFRNNTCHTSEPSWICVGLSWG